jgi:cell division protein FtsI/penicillin-binding protein 2
VYHLAPNGTQRYYPKMDLAGQIVGFISPDGQTREGVESSRNKELSGDDGLSIALVDAHGDEMFTSVEREPKPGESVVLTIDSTIQNIAETALREGIDQAGAATGAAVVLEAGTGEILASTSYPSFNPNAYRTYGNGNEAFRNRLVKYLYEPGSTMKIMTASAALNEHVMTPDTMVDCSPGSYKVPGRAKPITEDQHHNYGNQTFEDVIVRSSNVGAVMTGLKVGADRMLQYARRFPFGQRIGPDFGQEEPGYVAAPGGLSQSALASLSMGYEVMVTPLQMAAAASIIANGGVLVEPHVVRGFIAADGRRREIQPRAVRQVITPETASIMTAIMEDVVVRGTGKPAALDRFLVAGKTGTAKKVVNKRYSETDYNVSFVGFVPSRNPRFIILVVLDSPHKVLPYGGTVAGPIFRRIANLALQYDGTRPSINPAPPVVLASDRLLTPPPVRIPAVTPVQTDANGRRIMPDLRGLALRDALRESNAAGLQMSPVGEGVVVFQSPAPGDPLDGVSHGVLQLRRDPAKPGGGDR